jgi:hypothetical protein
VDLQKLEDTWLITQVQAQDCMQSWCKRLEFFEGHRA